MQIMDAGIVTLYCLSAAHVQSYYMREIVIDADNSLPQDLFFLGRYTPAIPTGSGVASGGPG